jgi:1-acyl-sn-glycerol-3-phosphate acyltransferase
MATFITMTCIFGLISWWGLLIHFAYGFSVRLCRLINYNIATVQIRRLFSLFLTYMNFRFAGESHLLESLPSQYLVLSNHQSLLDIPLYMRFLDGPRLRFVAKAELGKNIPLVSAMLKSGQHCLVNRRGSPAKAMKELDAFAERVVKNSWIPVVFPEGTRSLDGNLLTFQAAGFRRILDKAPMPVAVCAVDGAWRISSLLGMAIHLKDGFYRVKVLKIYPAPQNKAEQVYILEEGKSLIQEQLERWRGETQCN